MSAFASPRAPRALLRQRSFVLLWVGESISVLGDYFYLIALPWLVLQVTGDATVMASVLAVAAIPRAALMLFGGVASDRFSPRVVMLGSNLGRMVAVGVLALLVLTGLPALGSIYLAALGFGVADAFFFPAQAAILPGLVARQDLPRANALITGSTRLSALLGPALAGLLIAGHAHADSDASATLATSAGTPDLDGIGVALLVDAFTFMISIATLMAIDARPAARVQASATTRPWKAIAEGFRHVRGDPTVRVLIPFFSCMSFIAAGALGVGLPVLADGRFGGAAEFGWMLSASAAGAVLGMLAVGQLPRPPSERIAGIAMVSFACFGFGLILLGLATTIHEALAALLLTGLFGCYGEVTIVSFIQARIPADYLGRVMSLLMFFTMGLAPLSMASAGALLHHGVGVLLLGGGCLYCTLALASLLHDDVRFAPASHAAKL